MNEIIIVSRHAGAVQWLLEEFPCLQDVPVIPSATAEDVRGKVVVGNIPLHLAKEAARVVAIEFSGEPPRGQEYGPEEMRSAGAHLTAYRVELSYHSAEALLSWTTSDLADIVRTVLRVTEGSKGDD